MAKVRTSIIGLLLGLLVAVSAQAQVTTIQPVAALPLITDPIILDGSTASGFAGTPVIELDGTNAGLAVLELVAGSDNSQIVFLIINRATGDAVDIDGVDGVIVRGNRLGTDATGTLDLGNFCGIRVSNADGTILGGTNAGDGNLVSGNTYGIIVQNASSNTTIQGNIVGLNAAGDTAIANTPSGISVNSDGLGNVIGGTVAGTRNVVSGNTSGITITGSNVTVLGNYVGTDFDGTSAIPNLSGGIALDASATDNTIGGTTPEAANLVSGNGGSGIEIGSLETTRNVVIGNVIGLDRTGTVALPNPIGVKFEDNAHDNRIGGIDAGEGNKISGNSWLGVSLNSSTGSGNAILGNSIVNNGSLGIDLLEDGVTENDNDDDDTGPNGLLNFPEITSATVTGGIISLSGVFDVPAGNYRLEFFLNPSGADPTGNGEGESWVGSASLSHSGNGDEPFGAAFSGNLGDVVTATVTEDLGGTYGSTSEFSDAEVVVAPRAISGIVFEDSDFNGTPTDFDGGTGDLALANVDVELYDAADTYIMSTTTAVDGSFTFTGLPDGDTFKVRARSETIGDWDTEPAGGLNASVPANWPYPLAEMTWAGAVALLGGQDPAVDDTETGDGAGPGDTWVAVTVSGGDATDVNLGFAYNLITHTADDGLADANRSDQGSLRQFLKNANSIGSAAGTTANSSQFHLQMAANQIDGTDTWWRIAPTAPLPILDDGNTVIDGSTQRLNSGIDSNTRGPEIELHGLAVTGDGLYMDNVPGNTIRELVINGFDGLGIVVTGASASNNAIYGCYIGTNAVGESAIANSSMGLWITTGASFITIGGSAAGEGNLISGNGDQSTEGGVSVGISTSEITILGNRIGVDRTATNPLSNAGPGISLSGGVGIIVGGASAGEGNILAANGGNGIRVVNWVQNLTVKGNRIGVGATGQETNLGNGSDGLNLTSHYDDSNFVIGGLGAGEGNIIAHNGANGIRSSGTGTGDRIEGNLIGSNVANGIQSITDGVVIAGNTLTRNGFGRAAILLQNDPGTSQNNNRVFHNTIYNSWGAGIDVDGLGAIVRNNIITGSNGYGINVTSGSMTESHNLVTDATTNPPNTAGQSNVALDATDLNFDPMFLDEAGGDFALTECSSPAINAGLDLGVDQPDLNGPVAGLFTGPSPDMGAQESSCVTVATQIAGLVFEDVDFVGTASPWDGGSVDVVQPNVDVELYDGTDNFVASTTTDVAGNFSFLNVTAGNYKLRVRTATLGDADTPPAGGLNAGVPSNWPYPLPEMTWGHGAAMLGGQDPAVDDGDTGNDSGPGDTYVEVAVAGGGVTGIQLGFAYNLIVNTGDDGLVASLRSDQGSLRQFFKNSNAITGSQASYFNLPVTDPGYVAAGSYWSIKPTVSALPALIDPVVLDAYTQPGANAGSQAFPNALNPVLKVEIDGSLLAGSGASGLALSAGSSTIRGLAVNSFTGPSANGIDISANGLNTIQGNFVGTDVTGTVAKRNDGYAINIGSPDNLVGGSLAGEGNLISGSNSYGVWMAGSGNRLEGNFIGTDVTGTQSFGHTASGVGVISGTNTAIGGGAAGAGNLISGNSGNGIWFNSSPSDVTVQGNRIGTDISGTLALGNSGGGVLINCPGVTVGGTVPGEGNLISGNMGGVTISGSSLNAVVQGNLIGTDVNGTSALGNANAGILVNTGGHLIGGSVAGAGNVISGSATNIVVTSASATSNDIQGNLIGTDISGTIALSTGDNIRLDLQASGNTIGGTSAAERNVISGAQNGIVISDAGTTGNTVAGNYIGTDVSGSMDLGNIGYGIQIDTGASGNIIGGTVAGARNIISGNDSHGIYLRDSGTTGNFIQGNYIGLDATGTAALGNSSGIYGVVGANGNTIGGDVPGEGNVLSGNTNGMYLGLENTTIQGNLVGTNAAGTGAIPNANHGIYITGSNNTIGGTTVSARNVVSGNSQTGILISNSGVTGNLVQGNFVGTDVFGTGSLGNQYAGIRIATSAAGNTIGGMVPEAANVVAHNGRDGVALAFNAGLGNQILGNAIYDNAALGIDLNDNQDNIVEINDPDDTDGGPNGLQNYPDLTTAITDVASSVTVSGTFNSTANTTFRVEFFLNAVADGSGYGEGAAFLGSDDITTDANGDASFSLPFAGSVPLGQFVSATATDPGGNTSEFSANVATSLPPSFEISGTVFEDVDFAGTAAEWDNGTVDAAQAGVDVELYDAGDVFLATTVTDGTGAFTFGSLGDGLYKVRVRSATLGDAATPPAGGLNPTVPGTWPNPLPEMTWAHGAARLGGQDPAVDDNDTPDDSGPGDTWVAVTVSGGSVPGVNLGFAYNVVTNTLDDGAANDSRSGQGSLRQFLKNSNAITGVETTYFEIPVTDPGYDAGGSFWSIQPVLSALPEIADPAIVDGYTQAGASPATQGFPNAIDSVLKIEINGTQLAGSGVDGLTVSAGNSTIRGLAINSFTGASADGILVVTNGSNTIRGNFIGTDISGTGNLGNAGFGITLDTGNNSIGGTVAGAGNIISGNGSGGVVLTGSGATLNLVEGNFIGLDATGTNDLGNGQDGVLLQLGANANTIGGTSVGAGNVVSGNGGEGVAASDAGTDNNTIAGNLIGTDIGGAIGVPNDSDGVRVANGAGGNHVGGLTAAHRNIISGNGARGILIGSADGNFVEGNFIGVDIAGATPLGNGYQGVEIGGTSSGNTIGGTSAGAGNIVAHNTGNGIVVLDTAVDNRLLGNSVHDNTALGIDLANDGVTTNDPGDGDTGPNQLQNYPVLSVAGTSGVSPVRIEGTLNSTASSTFRIEFFANTNVGGGGTSGAWNYIGTTDVTTDAAGNASFDETVAAAVPVGGYVSAIATGPTGNSSEFSDVLTVTGVADHFIIVDTVDDTLDGNAASIASLTANPGADGMVSLREAITAANNTANFGGPDLIHFDIAGPGPHTIEPTSALPTVSDPVVIDGSSEPDFVATPIIVLSGSQAGAGVSGLTIEAGGSTVRGLVIHSYDVSGIRLDNLGGNSIVGNFIGPDVTGLVGEVGNATSGIAINQSPGNLIGGTDPADRNIISGNRQRGISIDDTSDGPAETSTGNRIIGNYIGTDVSGAIRLPFDNSGTVFQQIGVYMLDGVDTQIGGAAPGEGNVISGNDWHGLYVWGPAGHDNLVKGNNIGLDASGVNPVGNGWESASRSAILFSNAPGNTVGGTEAGAENEIAGNPNHGIQVNGTSAVHNRILGNSIHDNGGLGVDLGIDGVTANDADDLDAGANNLQNFPILLSAQTDGVSVLNVTGGITSTPFTDFRIEFFSNAAADGSGYGEGQTYLGFVDRTTAGSGTQTFDVDLPVAVPAGHWISAAATSPDGDTSEFSESIVAFGAADLQLAKLVDNNAPNEGDTVTYTVTVSNAGPNDGTGITVTDLLPAGVTYVSDTPSQGTYVSGTGLWTVGDVANAVSATLTLVATVDAGTAGTVVTNNAAITAADQADPVAANNTASAVIGVSSSDLQLAKLVDNNAPNEGDTVTYTVTVSNAGPNDGTGITVTDLLPAGVTYVSDTPSQGTYVSGTGLWTVGDVANAGSATLTLVATVDAGTAGTVVTNNASVTAADQSDPVAANNTAMADINVQTVTSSLIQVAAVPLELRPILPGGAADEALRLELLNQGSQPETLESLTILNTAVGSGSPAELDADWQVLSLLVNSNGSLIPPNTTGPDPVISGVFNGSRLSFSGLAITLAPGETMTVVVHGQASLGARDGDILAVAVEDTADLQYGGASFSGATWPLSSGGGLTVDGMVADQISIQAVEPALFVVGSVRNLTLDAVLPANGYEADQLHRLNVINTGTATDLADIAKLECWADDGDNLFHPATDDLLGEFAFTGSRWELTGLNNAIPLAGQRIFVSADIAETATEGRTFQLGLPSNLDVGVGMESGNDGPIDREVVNPFAQAISTADRIILSTATIVPGTVTPGETDVPLVHLVALNSYAMDRRLTSLTVSNGTVGMNAPGLAERDGELDYLKLRVDGNGDGVMGTLTDDPVLATGVFQSGTATFSGLTWDLAAGSSSHLFLTGDISLSGAADQDVISAFVAGGVDLTFASDVVLSASWPLDSGARWTVDGMVAAQVGNTPVPSQTLAAGEGPVLVLDLELQANGYAEDTLTGLQLVNRGTASENDIADMRLWRDGGDGVYSGGSGDDLDLGPFVWVADTWLSPVLDTALPAGGGRFFVGLTVAAAPANSSTVQMAVPVGGITVASDNDGPVDQSIEGAGTFILSTAPLLAELRFDEEVSTIGQAITARMLVRNVGTETLLGVAPKDLVQNGDGTMVLNGGPTPVSFDLAPGAVDSFAWDFTASSTGEVTLTGLAAGIGEISGQVWPSVTTASNPHEILEPADSLELFAVANMPFTINRGQTDVVPLTLTFVNPGGASRSDALIQNLRIRLVDDEGAGIVPDALLSRVVVNEGGETYLVKDTLENSGNIITLNLTSPVRVTSLEPVTLGIRLDVRSDAAVPAFMVEIDNANWFEASGAISGNPVSVLLQDAAYPIQSGLVSLLFEATELDVAAAPAVPLLVGEGQQGVDMLSLQLFNPGQAGLGSDVRVGSVSFTLTDTLGVPVATPSTFLSRLRLDTSFQTLLDVSVTDHDSTVITLELSSPLAVPVDTPFELGVVADIAASAAGAVRLNLADSSLFQALDGNSGQAVPVVYASDPVAGGPVVIQLAANRIMAQGTPRLPSDLIIGTQQVAALDISFRHPGTGTEAAILIESLTVNCRDEDRNPVAPAGVIDAMQILRDGTPIGSIGNPGGDGDILIPVTGLEMQPGQTIDLTLRLDLEPGAAPGSLELVIAGVGINALDKNLGLPVTAVPESGESFPLTSGLTRLQESADELRVDFVSLMPAVLVDSPAEIPTAKIVLRNPSSGGVSGISVSAITIRAADDLYRTVLIGEAAEEIILYQGENVWARTGVLVPTDTVAVLQPAAAEFIGSSGEVELEVVAILRSPHTVQGFRLGLDEDDVGVVQPGGTLVTVRVEPEEGHFFPYWTEMGSFSGASLAESYSNFPNPFAAGREQTTFVFALDQPATVSLRLMTGHARPVQTIISEEFRPAGLYQQDKWDGRNGNGTVIQNGVYVAELTVVYQDGTKERQMRKVAIVR